MNDDDEWHPKWHAHYFVINGFNNYNKIMDIVHPQQLILQSPRDLLQSGAASDFSTFADDGNDLLDNLTPEGDTPSSTLLEGAQSLCRLNTLNCDCRVLTCGSQQPPAYDMKLSKKRNCLNYKRFPDELISGDIFVKGLKRTTSKYLQTKISGW